jgi:hypothetical protein
MTFRSAKVPCAYKVLQPLPQRAVHYPDELRMPRMDGLDCVRRIREMEREGKVNDQAAVCEEKWHGRHGYETLYSTKLEALLSKLEIEKM